MRNIIKDIIDSGADVELSTDRQLPDIHEFIFGGDVLVSLHSEHSTAFVLPNSRRRDIVRYTLWIYYNEPLHYEQYGPDYRKMTEDEKVTLWSLCAARML